MLKLQSNHHQQNWQQPTHFQQQGEGAVLFLLKAFQLANVPKVVALSASSTLLTAIVGIVVLKEEKHRTLKIVAGGWQRWASCPVCSSVSSFPHGSLACQDASCRCSPRASELDRHLSPGSLSRLSISHDQLLIAACGDGRASLLCHLIKQCT